MTSTTILVSEVAELRQLVRDLVDAGRDVLALAEGNAPAAMVRLERTMARAGRAVGRAP